MVDEAAGSTKPLAGSSVVFQRRIMHLSIQGKAETFVNGDRAKVARADVQKRRLATLANILHHRDHERACKASAPRVRVRANRAHFDKLWQVKALPGHGHQAA
jgi:hypothetical protein